MTIEGALVREQGVTFAIVIVKQHIVNSPLAANDAIRAFQPAFPGIPVVLLSQDCVGTPSYFGRRDIVQFLSNVPLRAIPWQHFSIS